MKFTIVEHREGWCVAMDASDPNAWNVATLCNHYVIGPLATKSGKPTCPDCIAVLKGAKTAKRAGSEG